MAQTQAFVSLYPPAEQRLNPFPFYANMRQHHPIAHDGRDSLWAVYRYEDVRQVLSDNETFSSDLRRVIRPRFMIRDQPPSLISSDVIRHKQLRTPITSFFTANAVAGWEPRILELVHQLLDRVAGQGHMDIVRDLAEPLPLSLIVEMLGVPMEDQEYFKSLWSQWLIWRNERSFYQWNNHRKRPGPWIQKLDIYLRSLATQRYLEPANDLMSTIVRLEVDGSRLLENEVIDYCALLLIGAHVTSTHLIANAVYCLLKYPETFKYTHSEPTGMTATLNEVLRYYSPVQAASRVNVKSVELAGCTVPAGSEIIAWIGSANRDPAVFPNPDYFDVKRQPNPHIAFGQGFHACFGAALARLQARVAVTAILQRMRNLELVESENLKPNRNPFLYGSINLPIQFCRKA